MDKDGTISGDFLHVGDGPAHSILIKYHDVIVVRLKFLPDRPTIFFGRKSCSDHRQIAQKSDQLGIWSARHYLPANPGLQISEATCPVIGIFKTEESNMRPLTGRGSRQLGGIDAITCVEWNRNRSPKPQDRNGQDG